jgi:hypothetical protein
VSGPRGHVPQRGVIDWLMYSRARVGVRCGPMSGRSASEGCLVARMSLNTAKPSAELGGCVPSRSVLFIGRLRCGPDVMPGDILAVPRGSSSCTWAGNLAHWPDIAAVCQSVVQGRRLSGLSVPQMWWIRLPATANASTATVTPFC